MSQSPSPRIWTKEEISSLLGQDYWLCRGILAIYSRQTHDEQQGLETTYRNREGFSGADARFLSAMAQNLKGGKSLSRRQLEVSRRMMGKYAGQLTKIANKKI